MIKTRNPGQRGVQLEKADYDFIGPCAEAMQIFEALLPWLQQQGPAQARPMH